MAENNSKREATSIWRYIVDVAAVIGCLGTLIFGWMAYKVGREAIWEARKIAIESGSLDNPELHLQLGTHKLDPGFTSDIFLGAPFLEEEKRIDIASLAFIIRNPGKKTARNVDVTDRFQVVIDLLCMKVKQSSSLSLISYVLKVKLFVI